MSGGTSKIVKYLPIVNLGVGCTALYFQLGILYPWHPQIKREFREFHQDQVEKIGEFRKSDKEWQGRLEKQYKLLSCEFDRNGKESICGCNGEKLGAKENKSSCSCSTNKEQELCSEKKDS